MQGCNFVDIVKNLPELYFWKNGVILATAIYFQKAVKHHNFAFCNEEFIGATYRNLNFRTL